jgi:hypothetical protein
MSDMVEAIRLALREEIREVIREELARVVPNLSVSPPSVPANADSHPTLAQWAELYHVSRRTVAAWVKQGLPVCGRGRAIRVDRERAEVWMRERTPAPAKDNPKQRLADAVRAASRKGRGV